MRLFPRQSTDKELMDLPPESYTREELEGTLADIVAVNRHLGDNRAMLKHFSAMVAGLSGEKLSLLDIGTGSADIPLEMAKWCKKNDILLKITGIDNNARTIDIARKFADRSAISLVLADGLRLPFGAKSFDFVTCSKTLHHFTPEEGVQLIREMMRVARRGYMIMDLRRSWMAYILIRILTRLFTKNRLTRNDGPASVLRSFTPGEIERLALAAGAPDFHVCREPFWLTVLKGEVR